MSSRSKKTIDLRTTTLLGPSCKFFESLPGLLDKNTDIAIKAKNWKYENKDGANLLWDPNKHPEDLYKNLILSTFPSIEYLPPTEYTLKDKISLLIPPFFNSNKIVHYDFSAYHMESEELERYKKQQKDHFLSQKTISSFVMYFFFYIYMNFFFLTKEKPVSKGFRYKLPEDKNTENLKSFISENKQAGVKYILISVLWDEGMQFEVNSDRLKGGPKYKEGHEIEFENLKKYVKDLDNYALKTGKIKFILASKKAVDWENFLETDYIDLRNFEELGFSMSQSIYIAQELSDISINWPSTYGIWITNCSDIIHLTWQDNKDTAKWARNTLHKKPIERVLELINIQ